MKRIKRTFISLVFAASASLSAAAQVQQPALPTSPALDRAIVVEELEHNVRGALELYAALANDAALSDPLRRHAALRLGRSHATLGDTVAARAALAQAAKGEDSIARLAQADLADPGRDEERSRLLREEARRWIDQVPNQGPSIELTYSRFYSENEVLRSMRWIGQGAVPELVRGIEGRRDALGTEAWRVQHLAALLWFVGGPDAARYLDSLRHDENVELRRVITRGLYGDNARSDEMVAVAQLYLADPDPTGQVVIAALGNSSSNTHGTWRRYDVAALLALVDSPVGEVRAAVLNVLADAWGHLRHVPDYAATTDRLIPSLARALDDINPEVVQAAHGLFGRQGLASEGSRALLAARLPEMRPDFSLNGGSPNNISAHETTVSQLLPMLRKLGPVSSTTRTRRDESVRRFVGSYLPYLKRDSLELTLEFGRLGYDLGNGVTSWIQQHCKAEDAETVLAEMVHQEALEESIVWLAYGEETQTLPAGCFPYLQQVAEQIAVRSIENAEDDDQEKLLNLLHAIGRVGTPEAVAYITKQLTPAASEDQYSHAAMGLLEASSQRTDEDILAAMRHALVLELEARSSQGTPGPKGSSDGYRQCLFARLVELGDPKAFELLPRAHALGMPEARLDRAQYPKTSPFVQNRGQGVDWIVLTKLVDGKRLHFHGYDEATLASIWDGLLGAPADSSWNYAWVKLKDALGAAWDNEAHHMRHEIPQHYRDTSPRLVEVAARHWAMRAARSEDVVERVSVVNVSEYIDGRPRIEIEREGLRYLLDIKLKKVLTDERAVTALEQLHAACFRSRDSKLRRFAVEFTSDQPDEPTQRALELALGDSDASVASEAIDRVFVAGQSVPRELFARILGSPSATIRRKAISSLAPRVEGGAVEFVKSMLNDPVSNVRIDACLYLGTQVDANPVPELLTALTDINAGVRTAAADSLRAIRFYQDEKAHWDRAFAGSLLSANSAAEALLRQAGPGSTREVRLLAIRSLGTLGAAETLPFLIEWTSEADSELAAAARAAIARIHAQGE